MEMGPIDIEPEVMALCTTDLVYLRASPGKPPEGEQDNPLELLPAGAQMAWTGEQAQATADGTVAASDSSRRRSGQTIGRMPSCCST